MDYNYYMKKALDQAKKALFEGEFPVGCVIVHEENIIGTGLRTGTTINNENEIDHAEMIALRQFAGLKKDIDTNRITLFSTLEPCLMCFGAILISGIKKIVYAYEDVMGGGTRCDLTKLAPLYNIKVSITPGILRKESIELFKSYFADHKNNYLRGTLFAEHTISL